MNLSIQTRYDVESALKVFFLITIIAFTNYSFIIALAVCILAVTRRQKPIELSRAYFQKVLRNQYGTNIMFILSFGSIGSNSMFFYASLSLHFLTGIAQYIKARRKDHPFVIKYIQNKYLIISESKGLLLETKAKIQFSYLIVTIIFTLFNFSKILSTVIYIQYIVLRYKLSDNFRNGLASLDYQISTLANKYGLNSIYLPIKGIFTKVNSYFG